MKRVATFDKACQVADRKRELFDRSMANTVRAWNAWQAAESRAAAFGRRVDRRESERAEKEPKFNALIGGES